MCVFDVQVFVYTCAPLSDEFETTDSKPGFGHQNQFCVVLRSVLFLQKTLSNGDDDLIGFFDFFTIEKREFLQHVFLYVAPQSAINRISTSTPRSTLHYHSIQTTLLCQQYISMSHTYQYRKHITSLQSTINPITRYYSYTKNLTLRNIISTSVSRNTDNTRALRPLLQYCLFVTARLAVQLNGIIQNHSTCRFVVTTQLHFHQVINHNACCRKGIFKNCCSQFISFNLYIGILRVMDILQSCAQPQDYFRCHQLRMFCTSITCKSSTVVYFLYGAFTKRIIF